MSPIPPAEFAAQFRALVAEERTRFVAALWRARGWETTVGGDTVVATRGQHRRQLRVVAPRLLGAPDLPVDLDVVVATNDDESLRTAAAAVGATYVDPAVLRDLLCYGVPRSTGERLARDHLGCSLVWDEADEEQLPTTGDGSLPLGIPGWPGAGSLRARLPEPGRAAVVLLVLAVVGVAVVAPGALRSPDGPPATSVPNGTFTPGTVGAIGGTTTATPNGSIEMPLGLSPSGVTDVGALATATVGGLAGEGWVLHALREGPDRTVWQFGGSRWTQTVRVEDAFRYQHTTRWWYRGENGSRPSRTSTVFQETYGGYVRENTSSGTRYHVADNGEVLTVDDFQSRVRTAIVVYLSTDDSGVECVETRSGTDDCTRYRVVAMGRPTYLSGPVEDYRATATVTDAGFVQSLNVEYTVPEPTRDGEREWVRFGFAVRERGDVAVADPPWLDEARANVTATDAQPPSTASPRTATDG